MATVATLSFVVSETIESFDEELQEALRTSLSTALGCFEPDCSVTISVTSRGGVNVEAQLTMPLAAANQTVSAVLSAASNLTGLSSAGLSSVLNTSVESSAALLVLGTIELSLVTAPPPPPSSPPAFPVISDGLSAVSIESDDSTALPALVGVTLGAVALCGCVVACLVRMRRRSRVHDESSVAQPDKRLEAAARPVLQSECRASEWRPPLSSNGVRFPESSSSTAGHDGEGTAAAASGSMWEWRPPPPLNTVCIPEPSSSTPGQEGAEGTATAASGPSWKWRPPPPLNDVVHPSSPSTTCPREATVLAEPDDADADAGFSAHWRAPRQSEDKAPGPCVSRALVTPPPSMERMRAALTPRSAQALHDFLDPGKPLPSVRVWSRAKPRALGQGALGRPLDGAQLIRGRNEHSC